MKKTLIAGITGQEGSCLAEFPLEQGYERSAVRVGHDRFGVIFGKQPGHRATSQLVDDEI
jgi:GDP-D-mannose dehydratase